MKRMVAIVAAAVVVLLGLGTAGMVWVHADDDPGWGRHSLSTSGWMGGAGGMPHHSAVVTSEADYLIEMVAHHREAVAAAEELSRSERPEMRAFGRDVVATQSAQITSMEGWLAAWYPDERADSAYEPMMRDLTALSGDALDRVFLEDMIGHHMAAVMMSQQLLVRGLDEHEAVGDLATKIRNDQMDEIRWMRAEWSTMGP
ncbi:protein of unknown function [Nocardioides alpinus]|uniref:DUF305 domain-containing protein n=1 Tax=Nocardioides alpinus TaxID=748909 RepID=A0A1I0Z8P9_9ACTN|nr:DUF305 domain-containing protein [Nocardioides alpinus]PKH38331.1 DUF305 domain-containing protein [Nocardioides alpinus]SFB21727.1 protein of unknown function [Nocardioides alpinus]